MVFPKSAHDRSEFASIHIMKYHVVNIEDLRWLLGHTGGFRGGYVTDVQVSKRRLLDEASGREVPAGTTVTVVIRYRIRQMVRVAKLTMTGVTDFSMFEQEGADCSTLGVIQAELTDGKLRFWFDPQGELYVVCEEAQLEEVAAPSLEPLSLEQVAQWTFQSAMPDWPTVTWLLAELDVAGVPCTWRATTSSPGRHPSIQWEGDLLPASMQGAVNATGVHCHVVRAARWARVRRGVAGPWGAGSPYWSSAFAPGGPDCPTVLRPVFGGQYDYSRRGMAELEVIRTATRG